MKELTTRRLQAHEFAALTGVTVRTLHHYDRLGLLKPRGYTQAGYRLYEERDIVRLEQIVALKFIGLPLKEIKLILDRNRLDMATTLRLQREILADKRRHLDQAIKAIEHAERLVGEDGALELNLFRQIIEVMNMQKDTEWMKKYYTEEQLAELSQRWSPELQARVSEAWATLIKDVEAATNAGVRPESVEGQRLAERWAALIGEFTGGDPAISKSLQHFYADEEHWPADFKKPFSDDVQSFINEAMKSNGCA